MQNVVRQKKNISYLINFTEIFPASRVQNSFSWRHQYWRLLNFPRKLHFFTWLKSLEMSSLVKKFTVPLQWADTRCKCYINLSNTNHDILWKKKTCYEYKYIFLGRVAQSLVSARKLKVDSLKQITWNYFIITHAERCLFQKW